METASQRGGRQRGGAREGVSGSTGSTYSINALHSSAVVAARAYSVNALLGESPYMHANTVHKIRALKQTALKQKSKKI